VFTSITTETPPLMSEQLVTDIGPIQVETNGAVELLESLEAHKAADPMRFQHTY